MQCNRCGVTLPPGATTCPNCGNPTPYNVSNPGPSPYDPTVAAPSPYGNAAPPYGTPPTDYGSSGYGTPPAPQPYGAPDPYGTPPGQQPYGAPQQAPYGAPQQPPYGFPPAQQPPKRRSNVGLIIGIVLLVLLLICAGGIFFIARGVSNVAQTATQSLNATATAFANNNGTTPVTSAVPTGASTPSQQNGAAPSGSAVASTASGILSNLQIASAVDSNYTPTTVTSTFKPGQKVYATFLINTHGQKGYAGVKWYIDGTFGKGSNLAIDPTFNHGYFAISYNVAARGAVEIYWCTQSNCSDEQLAAFAPFTVSNTASTQPSASAQSALAMRDMDRRTS
ncbi:MAG: hypothetical protein H0W02_20325 [Ktedonobacteraceae bacterium]|nr:hypothetical protein [Ktedonobacteraceae bacterium]